MSSSGEISEAIEEEIVDDVYEEDGELSDDVDIREHIAESLADSEHSVVDPEQTGVPPEKLNASLFTAIEPEKLSVSVFTAIEGFSDALAKTVVEEALLINEIHERDKLNERPLIGISGDQTGPARNGKDGDSNGYDPYLMQKLLRSEADPNEATIVESMPDSDRYPGLDPEDRYVKDEVDRVVVEHNDQNNNQVAPYLEEGLGDTALETIHEDTELQFHRDTDVDGPDVAKPPPEELEEGNRTDQTAEDTTSEKKKSIKFNSDDKGQDGTHSEKTAARSTVDDGAESAFSSSSEETEDEADCCEMTYKEKKAVVLAVRDGDIDLVELLLEKRRAHIDMLWYGETLLMVAIRMCQQEMAEFLIDNDIDLEYQTRIVEKAENAPLTIHKLTARQMAFDRGMDDIVELIDYKTNNLFGFIKPKQRNIRLRRPRPLTPPTPDVESDDDLSHDPDGDGAETGTTSHKDGTSRSRSKRSRKDSENSMTTFSDEESVHSSETKHKTGSQKTKSHAGSGDDLSQVFGPDEGYETMSPISPACVQAPHRLEQNIVGTRDYVSIRGTRSSHLLRAHTAAKRSARNVQSNNNVSNTHDSNDNVGSYVVERKRWTYCKSAPPPKNYSMESIPESVVRYGLPFVHGNERKETLSASDRQRSAKSQTSSRTSAYAEVIKVLSESKLLSPNGKSNGSIFPSIHEKTQIYRNNSPRNLNINYIYANRGSANSSRSLQSVPMLKQSTNLLTKRKLRA